MALSKLLMSSIAVALVICGVGADSGIEELRSRISALESSISERIQDIKRMDQSILNFESAIKEKSTSIFSLQSEIEILRKQAAADVEKPVEKVHKQASEMERQVARLKNEIEAQTIKRAALEVRCSEAENKAHELNLKLENFQETYEKQKLRIESIERALQVAEEELLKAQLEAASKLKRLTEVYEAWLPPWLALHMSHCREVVATHWNKHGKPALYGFFQKALEKSALVQKWVEPHLHATRTKWIPATKEGMLSFASNVQPFAQLLSAKIMKVYRTFKKNIATHIMKAQELVNPYFLEARKFSKPYVDQIANVAKAHVEKLIVFLDPYHRLAVHSYKKLTKTTLSYHNQKWIPATKEGMLSFASNVQPFAQLLSAKIMKVYRTSKKNIATHIMKAQELGARKFSKPYVDQIANVAKAYVEKLIVFLDPYRRLAVHSYKKLGKTTLSYHNQVRVSVHENLKKHELTQLAATRELSWFLASAILAVPVFFLFKLLSATFWLVRSLRFSLLSNETFFCH